MSASAGFAILGAGIFAKEAHVPALAALGDSVPQLRAVYSRSEASARNLAESAAVLLHLKEVPTVYHDGDKESNLDALLSKPDITAVIVVLPITLQPFIILKALAAGKHVLSEKPVAPDVKTGLGLINKYNELYKPKGLIWRVAENFEAEPGFRAAAEVIRSGTIGKVIFFKTVVANHIDKNSKWYKTPWRTVPDYQGGFLLDGGVHTIAALRVVLPRPLTHLSAFASLNKDYLKPHDTFQAIAQAQGYFHGVAELTWAFPTKTSSPADDFLFTGTDGWVSINRVSQPGSPPLLQIRTVKMIKPDGKAEEEKEEFINVPSSGVEAELASFFKAVAGKDDQLGLGDPMGALSDVAFIQAALNSNGNIVDLGKLLVEG